MNRDSTNPWLVFFAWLYAAVLHLRSTATTIAHTVFRSSCGSTSFRIFEGRIRGNHSLGDHQEHFGSLTITDAQCSISMALGRRVCITTMEAFLGFS
jgi:hypothetical protein